MAQTIGSVIIDVKADTQKLVSGFDRAEKSVGRATKNMKNAVIGLTTAYLSLEGVNAFSSMIKGSIDAADNVGKLAEKLAISASALSELEYAAGFADVSLNQLNASMSAMIRRASNFKRDGTGAASKAMAELGISLEFAQENFTDTETTFKILLDRLSQMPDGFKKTAVAQDLFSKSAADVVRLANMGTKELERLAKQGKLVGAVISDDMAASAAMFNDNMMEFDKNIGSISNSIANDLLPALLMMSNELKKVDNIEVLQSAAKEFTETLIIASSVGLRFVNGLKLTYQDIAYFITQMINGGSLMIDELSVKFLKFARDTRLAIVDTLGIEAAGKLGIDIDFTEQTRQIATLEQSIARTNTELSKGKDEWVESRNAGLEFNQVVLDIEESMRKGLTTQKEITKEIKKQGEESQPKDTKVTATDTPITTSLKDWQNYYITIGDYGTAWLIAESELYNKHRDLTAEQFSKLSEIAKEEFYDKLELHPIEIDLKIAGIDKMLSSFSQLEEMINSTANAENKLNKESKTLINFAKLSAKHQKDSLRLQKAEDKALEDYIDNKIDITRFNEIDAKNKHNASQNELQMYGAIAGASADLFEQGSSEAKAMQQVQMALAIVEGGLAVVHQMTAGDPYSAIPRAMAVAATVASFIGGFGGGGASATSATVSGFGTESEMGQTLGRFGIDEDTTLEDAIEELTRKIEIQNKIYENLGDFGGTFANALTMGALDISKTMTDAWRESFSNIDRAEFLGTYIGFDLENLTTANISAGITKSYDTMIEMFGALTDFETAFSIDLDAIGGNAEGVRSAQATISSALDEYTLSLIDLYEEMSDYRNDWIGVFESVSGDNKFTMAKLDEAFIDIEDLKTQIGSNNIIDLYEALINAYDVDFQEMKEMYKTSSQAELIQYMTDTFPKMKFNPENVYQYIESLELVGEAMVNSIDNINAWVRRNEEAEDTAMRLANAMGVTVAQSLDDLNLLATNLTESNNLLTDSELELLQANEEYLESIGAISTAIKSLSDAQDIIGSDILDQWQEADSRLNSLSDTFRTLGESIEDTIYTLLGGSDALDAQDRLIGDFWEKRGELDVLLAKDGDLTEEEESRLRDLTGDINKLSLEIQKSAIGDNTEITNELVEELGFLGDELEKDMKSLSIQDTIKDLTSTAIDYLGADSDIVEWLRTLNGTVEDIDFATYNKQRELEEAYARVTQEQTSDLIASMVANAYQTVLDRAPDVAGADYWTQQVETGAIPAATIGSTIGASAVVGGEISREDYVTTLYTEGLGRTPSDDEVSYWTNESLTPVTELASLFDEIDPDFKAFANGGIVNSPTVSLFGEAGTEAFVPLPDGKTIPVTMNNTYPSIDQLEKYMNTTDDSEMINILGKIVEKLDKIEENSKSTADDMEQIAYTGVEVRETA